MLIDCGGTKAARSTLPAIDDILRNRFWQSSGSSVVVLRNAANMHRIALHVAVIDKYLFPNEDDYGRHHSKSV